MYWENRKDRAGKPYYSFVQWDPKQRRNVRLRRSEVPANIATDAQADTFCRLRESEIEAAILRIERKLSWQKKFYDFIDLLELFEAEMKRRAPNSWKGPLYYFRQYALDFFLNVKQSNNINNWPLYYEEFRDWLGTVQTGRRTKNSLLATNSRNNVICALNSFLNIMWRKGKCDLQPKCAKFPAHMRAKRTAAHVLSEDEVGVIYQRLQMADALAADFFLMLVNTGMRLSEGLGVSLADFFTGRPEDKLIPSALDRHSLPCFGYIALESQVSRAGSPRGANGHVDRKPLKGRQTMDASSGRVIPLLDKATFNVLARRHNEQVDLLSGEKFGGDRRDYLLFDGLNKSNYTRLLQEAYKGTAFTYKSPHCARHTFATNLAGLTGADTGFCQLVLGHNDSETTLGYVHLFEQINRKARAKEQTKSKIALIE
ncbi:MAG: tyrosine-type recombinase/integrase [Bdellovibrionales bacterium]